MLRIVLAGASAFALSAAHAGTLPEDAKAFGVRDQVHAIAISPSGARLAMIVSGPGAETVLQVADVNSGQTLNLTKSDGKPQSLRSCAFAGESQLICRHSGIERIDKYLVNFDGLFAITADGKKMQSLRPKWRFDKAYISGSDGSVIDYLPGLDGSVLMTRNFVPDVNTVGSILGKTQSGLGVDRIDLAGMKITRVEPAKAGAWSYMTDGRGNVRLMTMGDDDHRQQMTGRIPIKYRTKSSRDWRDLGVYDMVSGDGPYPLAIDADSDSLYALKKTNGRDALYRIKLDGSLQETLVGSDRAVDIDGIVRLGPGQRMIGYTFADDRRRTVYFDADLAKLQSSLAKALPKQPQISFHGATADGQKIVILAGGDTNAGNFYRFDRATKQLALIMPLRPELENRTLAAMKPIQFAAADGTQIPAYLTLPPGSSGKNLPAIVMAHGGPEARDEWGFDWMVQFLAARGYAVIQPNFRGSGGFGEAWLQQNGFKSWKTSIGDVSAAAKYLVSEGIANPDKLAILGWSYGGYAALQSTVVEPGLYKAAVAIAPVTDLQMIKDEARDFNNEQLVRDYIGSGPHIREGSPLQNVAAIRVPVLLVHGNRDANVDVAQSDRMAGAMKAAGKSVEYVKFDNLDHQLDDSDARIQMLTKIGSFLEAALGK
jgi:dipeptidyl aminopeptidase/acylaminoacyl peptidase